MQLMMVATTGSVCMHLSNLVFLHYAEQIYLSCNVISHECRTTDRILAYLCRYRSTCRRSFALRLTLPLTYLTNLIQLREFHICVIIQRLTDFRDLLQKRRIGGWVHFTTNFRPISLFTCLLVFLNHTLPNSLLGRDHA